MYNGQKTFARLEGYMPPNLFKPMAKMRKNAVVHGASGKFGQMIVFRQLPGGRTILTEAPGKDPNRVPTANQIAQQKNFQMATIYARGVLANEEKRKLYDSAADKNRSISAYHVAVADFSKGPSIDEVNLDGYTGQEGDVIIISASDDFMVKEVKVTILNPDGSIADEGMAAPDALYPNRWMWMATKTNNPVMGDKIVITASDIPGHIAKVEQEFV
jgi:hypothetical protein